MELKDGKDKHGLVWENERCKSEDCAGKRITHPFLVSDHIWELVTEGNYNILCHPCFDEMAQRMSVDYEAELLNGLTFTRTQDSWDYNQKGKGSLEWYKLKDCEPPKETFVWVYAENPLKKKLEVLQATYKRDLKYKEKFIWRWVSGWNIKASPEHQWRPIVVPKPPKLV